MGLQHTEHAKIIPSVSAEKGVFQTAKKLATNGFSDKATGPVGGTGPSEKVMPLREPTCFTVVKTGPNGGLGPSGKSGGMEAVSIDVKTGKGGGVGPSGVGEVHTKPYGDTPDPRLTKMGASNHSFNYVNVGPNGGGTGPSGKVMGDI